jgi:hypothetical protein
MKKTLIALAWALAVIAGLALFGAADPLTRWGWGLVVFVGLMTHSLGEDIQLSRQVMELTLSRLEEKLDQIQAVQPSLFVQEGLYDLVKERREAGRRLTSADRVGDILRGHGDDA